MPNPKATHCRRSLSFPRVPGAVALVTAAAAYLVSLTNLPAANNNFAPPAGTKPYTFYPQGGNFWQDLFPNNFIDLDPGSGILDFNGTNYTYDGHQGIDTDILGFPAQAVGVPIFAALDGTVSQAHDGEDDMSTTMSNKPANYVVLDHGGGQTTTYFHMKKGSVAVTVGQKVKAGQQIGLTGSSGNSTNPHLHFESAVNGVVFEPFAGSARPGPSNWVTQPPFRTDLYIREFVMTQQDFSTWQGFPYDTTRTGTFSTGVQKVSFWFLLGNAGSLSSIGVRFLRPDGSVALAPPPSPAQSGRNPYYDVVYYVDLNVTGKWQLELSLSGQVAALAPFQVVEPGVTPAAQPPAPVQAAFDPPAPTASQVVFARITSSQTFADPNYQFIKYRYVWQVNGSTVRDMVSAGLADAIPHDLAKNGDTLTCTITPSNDTLSAAATQVSAVLGAPAHLAFFSGESTVGNGVYFLQFASGSPFGYYSYLADPRYLYHFDLGYEYVFDANDSRQGAYLYDFKSGSFFYTSPTFPFPYLYDFSLNTVLYYYADPSNPGRYNTNGTRFFYRFDTGEIITK